MSDLSPFSAVNAFQRGKATPVVIRVCLRRWSLSFYDFIHSAVPPRLFFSGETFLVFSAVL